MNRDTDDMNTARKSEENQEGKREKYDTGVTGIWTHTRGKEKMRLNASPDQSSVGRRQTCGSPCRRSSREARSCCRES